MLLGNLSSFSQQKHTRQINLIPELTGLNGSEAAGISYAMSGIVFNNGWGWGIGAGVDYYKMRSVPVFFCGRKEFGKADHHLFGYGQFGYNVAAPLDNQYPHGGYGRSDFSNGVYCDLGIGYASLNTRRRGFEVSIGYSVKTLKESYTDYIYRDFPPYGIEESPHSFSYRFNRLALKIGIRL